MLPGRRRPYSNCGKVAKTRRTAASILGSENAVWSEQPGIPRSSGQWPNLALRHKNCFASANAHTLGDAESVMRNRHWRTPDFHLRDVIVVLTLVSQLMVTFGFPLPAPSRSKPSDGVPHPCQSRPCGCHTSEQCWKGDCCCFTIEEKLTWAEANGVEPPAHVRPLVESRRSRPAPSAKKKSCCSEAEPAAEPSVTAPPPCCEKRKPAATSCSEMSVCEAAPDAECPHCAAKAQPNCCEKKTAPTPDSESSVRWEVGILAQKCRGEGPAGLFQLDPAVAPDLTPVPLAEPERGGHVAPRSDRTTSLTHSPPTRPPRSH